jgi:lycopene cyclase domain-containing protein
MSTYLWLNVGIIIAPLLLSFEKKVNFAKKFPAVLISILIVDVIFIPWDIIATARGHWAFNPEHVSTFSFFGLPPGEVLFFITVPYACLFMYETVLTYMKKITISYSYIFYLIPAVFCLAGAVYFYDREYSLVVLIASAGIFSLSPFICKNSLKDFRFFMTLGVFLILFMIFNGILTSLPIVTYGEQFNMNVRIFTIPLEDFFYNFTMLVMSVLVYDAAKSKWGLN